MKQLSIEELNASGNLTGIKLGGTSSDNELLIRSIINGLIDAGVVVAKEYTDSNVMPDAPKDGKVYGRRNGEWVRVELYPFEMLVTSPTEPTLIDVAGGTITTVDNGDGTFTFESVDNITHFKFDANKADITKVEFFYESLTNLNSTFTDLSKMTEFIANPTSFSNVTDCFSAWAGCSALTSFPKIDLSSVTNTFGSWFNCSALTSFPLIDLSSVTSCSSAWRVCSALTSFPQIDLSSATNISETWRVCSALTSFPQIDLSSATDCYATWADCSALTSFPKIDLISAVTCQSSWFNCSALTSFPLIDFSSFSAVRNAWENCSALHSFTGLDFSSLVDGYNAFLGCTALTQPPPTGTDVRDGNNATQGTWNIT